MTDTETLKKIAQRIEGMTMPELLAEYKLAYIDLTTQELETSSFNSWERDEETCKITIQFCELEILARDLGFKDETLKRYIVILATEDTSIRNFYDGYFIVKAKDEDEAWGMAWQEYLETFDPPLSEDAPYRKTSTGKISHKPWSDIVDLETLEE